MVPPPLSPPLCTLPPGPGPPRFVCFCEGEGEDGGPGAFNLYVTDAAELWSTCFTADSLAALVPGPEAASRLQALTLRLADQVCTLTRQLAGAVGGQCPEPSLGPVPASACTLGFFPSCGGDSCQPQKEPWSGASVPLTGPRSSERRPWTRGQEAVSRRVPHQPRLQEKPAGGVDFESP
ncbi:protein PAXX isoform X10 [Lutra lutra]|uniref:protein PAXX isoform X10 n=1 Tax=Lutra lutra TaxID=9657 RepID=UPI001FD08E69|nr:protein PAXX isoform X10 [Lutra lutra]